MTRMGEVSMDMEPIVSVAFRGKKYKYKLVSGVTVDDIKERVIKNESQNLQLAPSDLKLLYKGKDLSGQPNKNISQLLMPTGKQVYKVMAFGRSFSEVHDIQESHAEAIQRVPRIRDDLTKQGQRDMERRKCLGNHMLYQAAAKDSQLSRASSSTSFGFGHIETLANLPDEDKARDILNKLSTDPSILACMKQHKWRVGVLKEMYPEGKVGESAVCVMGLNRNKGQEILLRIRTDDLKGFRKILSIRKVLFHELAHNVHSEHDGKFFALMRQIEKECNDLDWTGGLGLQSLEDTGMAAYSGGTYRLGGNSAIEHPRTARDLRAHAAMNRMTREEEEIEESCGCGQEALFLPTSLRKLNEQDSCNNDTNEEMDAS